MTDQIQAFNFSANLLQSLIWEYEDAARLKLLLQEKQAWYNDNQSKFWSDWYRDVFDLRTANEFGLSVWSIILRVPIIVSLTPPAPGSPTWGFGDFNENFTRGNFQGRTGEAQTLTPDQARLVLQLRYFQLQSSGTIPEINRFLRYIFGVFPVSGRSKAWCEEGPDPMTIVYVFAFFPPAQVQFVLENFDILPRPEGVGSSIEIRIPPAWGFDIPHENFDNGNFDGN